MIESDYTFRRDRHGDPARKVVTTVATDSVNEPCLSLMARRKGAGDEYVVQGMLNYIDTAKPELRCDQEPSTMEIARVLPGIARRTRSTTSEAGETRRNCRGSRSSLDGLYGTSLFLDVQPFPSQWRRTNRTHIHSRQGVRQRAGALWRSFIVPST